MLILKPKSCIEHLVPVGSLGQHFSLGVIELENQHFREDGFGSIHDFESDFVFGVNELANFKGS